MQEDIREKKIDDIIQDLMKVHYKGSPIEFRLSKVFKLTEEEKKRAGAEEADVYLFWGFISLPNLKSDFLFGQFSLQKDEEFERLYRPPGEL